MHEQSWTNKAARQKQPYNHSSGSKSFLQRQYELAERRGQPVDRMELFRETYVRAGTFVSQATEDAHGVLLTLSIRVVPAWVSFGITTFLRLRSPMGPPIVLGVPLGSPKTRYVPTGSQIARVWERASSWLPLFRTLMGSEGKSRESWRATKNDP
ncbi:CACTA en-spm transposon protein [Cucumis melo var. makuwa]|uniref:CACTA en-spm transposon protein n=1 Tax=Cucumis melo var. makuwa TaxID=1194695 RepID=A0A5A7TGW4_CUCMM|nr:CACTA en-spm transposon protein [Cucumis melo var. makuwa]TYK17803.1 CACTA en-spm transposon protein [Cucumis melo var. makuwa]